LASLASLSLLTVTSCHEQHTSTNSVIFHHSKPVARLLPAPAHQSLRNGEHGTSVTVNDLFGNMPVRVKSRALALQRPDGLEKEWDNLRNSLVSLMLANSQLSKLIITDVTREKKISIRLTHLTGDSTSQSTPATDLERIGSILAQAGMIDSRNMSSWHVLSATVPDLTIRAAISTVPSPSKKLQFISLGDDPVLSRSNSNVLYNEINRLVSLSDFGTASTVSDGTPSICQSTFLDGSHGQGSLSGKSWAKPINKWPMFYIRIDSRNVQSLSGDDFSPDSERSLQRITDVLGAMVLEFLKQQHMRPRLTKRQVKIPSQTQSITTSHQRASRPYTSISAESSTEEAFSSQLKLPSFRNSQNINSGQNLKNWSRVKIAKNNSHPESSAGLLNQDTSAMAGRRTEQQSRTLPDLTQTITGRRQHSSTSSVQPGQAPRHSASLNISRHFVHEETETGAASADQLIPWVDSQTGKTHLINSRTGQTADHKPPSSKFSFWPDSLAANRQKRDHVQPSGSTIDPSRGQWVEGLLSSWENPVFTRSEKLLPTLVTPSLSHHCLEDIGLLNSSSHLARFRGKIRRHSLARASVIAQVDQKFILVKLHSEYAQYPGDDPESVLVLIDQHAADERCRVERLFKEMFVSAGPSTETTQVRVVETDALSFNVSPTESTLFRKYAGIFQTWGIHYKLDTKSDPTATVSIHSLPILIAERCRSEPNLVADLLRCEIWAREEDDRRPLGSKQSLMNYNTDMLPDEPTGAHSWVQEMSGCPQGILDLLNSRACRTAIMFNDPLSIEECKVLISRLAKCAFPFQCAHGRPSMIPILDLRPYTAHNTVPSGEDIVTNDGYDDYDENNSERSDFIEAFRKRYVN
jgi:DNA mismatch repair protein MLH3